MQWGSWGPHEFTGGTRICDRAPGHLGLELSALRADFKIETDVSQGSQPNAQMSERLKRILEALPRNRFEIRL